MASTEVERPGGIDIPAEHPPNLDVPQTEQVISVEFKEIPETTAPAVSEQAPKKGTKTKNERVQEKRKTNNNHQQNNQHNRRFRHDNDNRRFNFGRKRSYSFNGGGGKFGPPYKRWKRDFIVPPTKFLLGGNICDPLNLNSLQDEEINRAMNAVTPQSSPLPTPKHRKEMIEVLIPPNIHDPLNLTAPDDDPNYELRLISPKKKRPRHRRRKSSSAAASAAASSASTEAATTQAAATSESAEPADTSSATADGTAEAPKKPEEGSPPEKKPTRRSGERGIDWRTRRSVDDKIVSPVIPQPGAWKGPPPIFNPNLSWDVPGRSRNRHRRQKNKNKNKNQVPEQPVFKANNDKFKYGNYNRYYGYRNPDQGVDVRMKSFRKDLFHGKEVLDIGCNVGHVTLTIARHFGAKRVVGLDIDHKLIQVAKKNTKHYASCNPIDSKEKFPACMPILYGPLEIPFPHGADKYKFPHNVSFVQGNYVLDSDILLDMEKPQFDMILCLSVTKWFHLNFGDEGLKRAFRRMHAQLQPGGKLILEAQPWQSYKGKKKLTETIFHNFNSIQFFPAKFTEYLLSSEVGFIKCEVLGTPQNAKSRGFSRPIQMFTKAELPHNSPSETVPSTACGDAALPTETSVIRPEIVHPLVDAEEWVYAAPAARQDDSPEYGMLGDGVEYEAPEADLDKQEEGGAGCNQDYDSRSPAAEQSGDSPPCSSAVQSPAAACEGSPSAEQGNDTPGVSQDYDSTPSATGDSPPCSSGVQSPACENSPSDGAEQGSDSPGISQDQYSSPAADERSSDGHRDVCSSDIQSPADAAAREDDAPQSSCSQTAAREGDALQSSCSRSSKPAEQQADRGSCHEKRHTENKDSDSDEDDGECSKAKKLRLSNM